MAVNPAAADKAVARKAVAAVAQVANSRSHQDLGGVKLAQVIFNATLDRAFISTIR